MKYILHIALILFGVDVYGADVFSALTNSSAHELTTKVFFKPDMEEEVNIMDRLPNGTEVLISVFIEIPDRKERMAIVAYPSLNGAWKSGYIYERNLIDLRQIKTEK